MKKLDSQRSSSERCQMATVSLGEGAVSDALVTVEQGMRSVLIDQQRVAASLEETTGRTDNNNNDGDEERLDEVAAMLGLFEDAARETRGSS